MAVRNVLGGCVLLTCMTLLILFRSTWAESECDTRNATIMNCSGMGLTVIPSIIMGKDMPDNYQTLDFSNNKITRIPRLNFSSTNGVRAMYLNNNQIGAIETKAFEVMTKLTKLDLSMNRLTGLTMEEKQFDNLVNIETLIMNRNPLRLIRKDTFSVMDFNSLKHFDLSHCEINHIEVDALDLHRLEHLDLSWNELESLHAHAFKRLRQLLTLDLSHNKLTVVDTMPVLPVIQILNLDNNKIRTVSLKKVLTYSTELLEKLYVRNNDIQSFTPKGFPWALEFLDGIYLDNNPIVCDCRMKWVINDEDIKSGNFTIPCNSPIEHKGNNLVTIPAEQLKCEVRGGNIFKISFLAVVLIAILFAFLVSLYRTVKRKWRRCRLRQKRSKRYGGANYTSVYTKEGEDVKIFSPGYEKLVHEGQEFDV